MNKIDLEGCRAIITGGAQGIGLTIGRRLLDCGAVLVLWDTNREALEGAVGELGPGERVEAVVVDVS